MQDVHYGLQDKSVVKKKNAFTVKNHGIENINVVSTFKIRVLLNYN